MPFTLWLSRLCDAFHCLPSEAYAEWRRLPAGLLDDVLEARAFETMKAIVDRATTEKDIPASPLADLVKAVEELVALEDIAHAHGAAAVD